MIKSYFISYKTLLILLITGCIFSCIEVYEFDTTETNTSLVVDGQFTTSDQAHHLVLSRTNTFGQKFPVPIEGATITLFQDDLSRTYIDISEGNYILQPGDWKGISGKSYYIQIELPDGTTYQSTIAQMPNFLPLDTVHHDIVEGPAIDVNIDFEVPTDQEVFLRWTTDELYIFPEILCHPLDRVFTCYVPLKNSPQRINIFSSALSGNGFIEKLNVFTKTKLPVIEFYNRHYFNVYQHHINKDAYDYWQKVDDIANREGTIFDTPPAKVIGNIYNVDDPQEIVLGFFELTAIDTARTSVYPFEFRENVNAIPFCDPVNDIYFVRECCNCLRIPNSTLIKPDWIII